jgi:glycosyltransferase involved in cell wall biosynthesis
MASVPPITVLMPVYNGAEYLAESIDTILQQTLGDFEFLIINDGSKDGSQAILDDYAARDARIRVVQQANMGLAATLNKGLALARGEFVARQDQDDLSAPERLASQLAYLQAHPDCVLLGTRAAIMQDRTLTQRVHEHPTFNAVLKLDLLFNNPFVHSSVMLRRERVLALGGYCTDRSRQPPEDYELWARIGRSARVANLPERLLTYREAAQSMSRTGDNPFQSKLLLLSSENLALNSGLAEADVHCRDIATLFQLAPHARSSLPDLRAMEDVLQRCFARIAAEVESPQEQREFDARCAYWLDNLRHHYHVQFLHPLLARPTTASPTPPVTVLMAVYNGADLVGQAIESILAQTMGNFEFLILNDGSQDGTQGVLETYAARDARIRIVQQENMGLAAALNKGVSLARGELIARQDHDDLSAPERLEHQLAYMLDHPDCVLLGTRASIWSHGHPTDRAHDHPAWNAVLKADLLIDNPFVHSSVMLRRTRVLELGNYCTDRSRQPPEDYELWSRIGRAARIANLPQRLLVYREVPQSITRTGDNPMRSKVLLLAAENLALGSGLAEPDVHCRDIAALFHQAPWARSRRPDLAAMQAVLARCFERIAPEVHDEQERREFDARCAYWKHVLRRHYLRQVVQPAWVQPITTRAWRGARSMARRIRSLARKVVG